MIGVLVTSHAKMAEGIKSATQLIIGEQPKYEIAGYMEGANYDDFVEEINSKIRSLNEGDGVIVLTDLFGASPYNASAKNMSGLMKDGIPIRVVTGVNLPMVIEAVTMRDGMTLEELYQDVMNVAKEGIQEMLEALGL